MSNFVIFNHVKATKCEAFCPLLYVSKLRMKKNYTSTPLYLSVYEEAGFTFGIQLLPRGRLVIQGISVSVLTRLQGWTIDNGFPFSAGVRSTPAAPYSENILISIPAHKSEESRILTQFCIYFQR